MRRLAAVAALLFFGAQFAAGLHVLLEAHHDVHDCCTDDLPTTHVDACDPDHHAAPCELCASGRAPVAGFVASLDALEERTSKDSAPPPELVPVDPFHVDLPDSRGPPA
jgi:hypothetical protein